MKYLSALIVLLLVTFGEIKSQVSAENGESVSWYIENLFLGEAITISNISVNGVSGDSTNVQVGSFQNNDTYLPISSGIVMSSGGVIGSVFPSDTVIFGTQTTIFVDGNVYVDEDLNTIAGETVNDAISIEFDFVPAFEFIVYDYAFGSEEYPEYVNSFNDAFAFLISGPGISGPYSLNAKNAALLPDSISPVTINNVNNGQANCAFGPGPQGPCMNCEYYIDNCPIEGQALDGMTTLLTVLEQVVPNETYHIKLALGDALDTAFDSAVLLKEGSFKSVSELPIPTSVPALNIQELQLASNPVGDFLVMSEIPDYIKAFTITDLHGRVVVTRNSIVSDYVQHNVMDLDPSIYILTLEDENGRVLTQKILKE